MAVTNKSTNEVLRKWEFLVNEIYTALNKTNTNKNHIKYINIYRRLLNIIKSINQVHKFFLWKIIEEERNPMRSLHSSICCSFLLIFWGERKKWNVKMWNIERFFLQYRGTNFYFPINAITRIAKGPYLIKSVNLTMCRSLPNLSRSKSWKEKHTLLLKFISICSLYAHIHDRFEHPKFLSFFIEKYLY